MKFNKKWLAVGALAIGGYFALQALGFNVPRVFRASSYPIGIVNSVQPGYPGATAAAQDRLKAGLF